MIFVRKNEMFFFFFLVFVKINLEKMFAHAQNRKKSFSGYKKYRLLKNANP